MVSDNLTWFLVRQGLVSCTLLFCTKFVFFALLIKQNTVRQLRKCPVYFIVDIHGLEQTLLVPENNLPLLCDSCLPIIRTTPFVSLGIPFNYEGTNTRYVNHSSVLDCLFMAIIDCEIIVTVK